MVIVLAAALTSLWAAPHLPEQVASHWNIRGEANGYQPRAVYTWFMPVLLLLMSLLLLFLPLVDPLKHSFMPVRGAYYWFVIGITLFMFYIHGLSLAFNLGFKFNLISWMMPGIGLLILGSGFLLERARPNWFVGIRTPWTLSSPTVWEKTHRLGGLLFKIAGIFLIFGIFFPDTSMWLMLIPLLGVSLFLTAYSFVLYQQEQNAPTH